jgi:alpha-glucosidase
VGEIHIFDWPKWAEFYGKNLDELHMPYNFALIFARWDPAIIGGIVDAIEKAVPPGGWPNYVLGNHDEHRLASRIGAEAARVATMLLLTLRGTPTLYYGDEIGMHDVEIPPELEQDPWGKRVPGQNVGRDPERTPMQWDGGPNAGFGPAGSTPWLPIADDYKTINVAAEQDDPKSTLSFTRALLKLRRETDALNRGSYRKIAAPDGVLAYERESGGARYVIALNFTGEAKAVKLAEMGGGTIALSTHMDASAQIDAGDFSLRENEGLIIRLG